MITGARPDGSRYTDFILYERIKNLLPPAIAALSTPQCQEYRLEEKKTDKLANQEMRTKRLAEIKKKYFAQFDNELDKANYGPTYLANEEVAAIVQEALHYRDGKVYELHAYCIMPNHVHITFKVGDVGRPDWSAYIRRDPVGRRASSFYIVADILENLKWYTALKANQALRRSGQFWQHESYDHVVRDAKECERILWYVLNNPVKAGFVKHWRDWKWSYLQEGLL
jgi:REP element-mobilizing transposase RayT